MIVSRWDALPTDALPTIQHHSYTSDRTSPLYGGAYNARRVERNTLMLNEMIRQLTPGLVAQGLAIAKERIPFTPPADFADILQSRIDALDALLSPDSEYDISDAHRTSYTTDRNRLIAVRDALSLYEPTTPPADWFCGYWRKPETKRQGDDIGQKMLSFGITPTESWPCANENGQRGVKAQKVFSAIAPRRVREAYDAALHLFGHDNIRVYSPSNLDFENVPQPLPCDPVMIGRLEYEGQPIYLELARWNIEEDLRLLQLKALERLVNKLRFLENGCWEWTAATTRGYGSTWVRDASRSSGWRSTTSHRLMYELLVGFVPEGLELDHLCRNRTCANVDHLEPVTRLENVRRGLRGRLKTHCPQGHLYAGDNLMQRTSGGYPNRRCRACEHAQDAKRAERVSRTRKEQRRLKKESAA